VKESEPVDMVNLAASAEREMAQIRCLSWQNADDTWLPQGSTTLNPLPRALFLTVFKRYPDDPGSVCQSLLSRCLLLLIISHYYSSGSQISDIRHSRHAQVIETQPGSHQLRLTGMYFHYDHALRRTKSSSPASRQSTQPSAFQDPPLEERNFLCHRDLRGNDEADTICAEKGEYRRMERESRHFVRNCHILFLFAAESPAALYNGALIL
jgi:hypothetical protein